MPATTAVVLLAVLALAVREDLVRHRIPNALNLVGLGLGLFLAALAGGLDGGLWAGAGAAVGCAALLPFYLMRGMGAGDVKLMAAVGAFLGPVDAFLAAAFALVAGAILAVVVVAWRLARSRAAISGAPTGPGPAVAWTLTMAPGLRAERFPYAVAIGLGAISALWLSGRLDALLKSVGAA